MSVIGRSYAQPLPRANFFLALEQTQYYEPKEGAVITSVMTETDFQSQIVPDVGVESSLYFDLGKTVVTYDANGNKLFVYRLLRFVRNASYEGYEPTDYNFYVRTWSADASVPITVARIH